MPVKGVFQHPALFSKRQTADQGNAIISPREGTEDSVERNAARKIGVTMEFLSMAVWTIVINCPN